MKQKSLNLLYQFNENYAPYAGVSLTSILMNNMDLDKISVTIWGENLTEESTEKFNKLVLAYRREIVFLDSAPFIELMKELKLPTYRGSYAANLRLFVNSIFDKEVERVIYVDADTIINGSLEELIFMDMKEYPCAMCLDSLGVEHKKQLGFEENDWYFNSGVIVFNLPEWRNYGCEEKIITHIKNVRSNYAAPDQDLLNIVLKGKIKKLSPMYNFQPFHTAFCDEDYFKCYGKQGYYSEKDIREARKKVVVYHAFRFMGEFPWHKENMHPHREIFDEYLNVSLWRDYRKLKSEKPFSIRVEKSLFCFLPRSIFLILFKKAHNRFLRRADRMSKRQLIHKKM